MSRSHLYPGCSHYFKHHLAYLFSTFWFSAASLMHRAAVAELLYALEPDKKPEAVKLTEESTNNPVTT